MGGAETFAGSLYAEALMTQFVHVVPPLSVHIQACGDRQYVCPAYRRQKARSVEITRVRISMGSVIGRLVIHGS